MFNLSGNNEIVATIMFFPQGTVISTKGDLIMPVGKVTIRVTSKFKIFS